MSKIVDNAAGTKALRNAQVLAERQLKQDLLSVLRSDAGRRVLWFVIDGISNLHGSSYAGSRENTFFCEGQRSVGITLMQRLKEVNSELYVKMIGEALVTGINAVEKTNAVVDAATEQGEIE